MPGLGGGGGVSSTGGGIGLLLGGWILLINVTNLFKEQHILYFSFHIRVYNIYGVLPFLPVVCSHGKISHNYM